MPHVLYSEHMIQVTCARGYYNCVRSTLAVTPPPTRSNMSACYLGLQCPFSDHGAVMSRTDSTKLWFIASQTSTSSILAINASGFISGYYGHPESSCLLPLPVLIRLARQHGRDSPMPPIRERRCVRSAPPAAGRLQGLKRYLTGRHVFVRCHDLSRGSCLQTENQCSAVNIMPSG